MRYGETSFLIFSRNPAILISKPNQSFPKLAFKVSELFRDFPKMQESSDKLCNQRMTQQQRQRSRSRTSTTDVCVCVMSEKFFLKEKTIIMRKRCDYSRTGHAAGPQHSWNVSLTNQTVELKPPIEPSPVETPQTGCKDAQPAAKCFFFLREQICWDQTALGGFMSNHGERTEPQQRLGSVTMARV